MSNKEKFTFNKIELDLYPRPFKMGIKGNKYYILSTDEKLPTNSKLITMTVRILFSIANNIDAYVPKEYQDEYCLLTLNQLCFNSKDLNEMKQYKQKNDDNKFCEYYPSSHKEPDNNNNMYITKSKLELVSNEICIQSNLILINFTIFNESITLPFSLNHIYEELEYIGINNEILLHTLEIMIRRYSEKHKCIPEELKDEYCLVFGDKVWYHSKNYEDIVKYEKENPFLNYIVYFPEKKTSPDDDHCGDTVTV